MFLDSFGSRKSYTTFDNSLEECSLIDVDSYITKNKNDNEFVRLLFKHIDSRGIKDSDLYNSEIPLTVKNADTSPNTLKIITDNYNE